MSDPVVIRRKQKVHDRMVVEGFAAALALLLLCACSTGLNVRTAYEPVTGQSFDVEVIPEAEVSKSALIVIRERLGEALATSAQATESDEGCRRAVTVRVVSYRMRSPGARAGAGIFAGTDRIESVVVVREADSARPLGEFTVKSETGGAWGSATGLLTEHADRIVAYLETGRR